MMSHRFAPASQSPNHASRLACVLASAFDKGSPVLWTLGSNVTTAPSGEEQSTQERIAQPQSQNGTR